MLPRQRGFTIVELIITVIVAAVLAAIAVPNMSIFVKNNARAARLNSMVTALNYTRAEAVNRNARVTLCKSSGPGFASCAAVGSGEFENGWIVFTDADGDGVVDAGDDEILRVFQPDMGGVATLRGRDGIGGPADPQRPPAADTRYRRRRHRRYRRNGAGVSMMNVYPIHGTARRRDTGFSLMEVLVALLVLAIGLLGLAALQAQGLRFNQDAYIRSQATSLAYDIIDRMRTNRDLVANYAVPDPGGPCDPTVATVPMDLTCWHDAVEAALPGADATIAANATANYYDITIRWVDREPLELGGTIRAPATKAECENPGGTPRANRVWDAAAPAGARCKVTQTWTIWP